MATDSYGHEVTENTPGAHSHDHTHAAAAAKGTHAAHCHPHLHLEDPEADAKVNGPLTRFGHGDAYPGKRTRARSDPVCGASAEALGSPTSAVYRQPAAADFCR
jgi:hypothetical protein